MRAQGIAVLNGEVARRPEDASRIHSKLGSGKAVVKAQVLAGGRGKAGGIKISADPQQSESFARELLGKSLVTHQTGPQGEKIKAVFVEAACDIAREFYLAITIDRSRGCAMLLFSPEGGVEIESVSPEKIFRQALDPASGLPKDIAKDILIRFGLSPQLKNPLSDLLARLCKFFADFDLSLLEINPLVQTKQGDLIPLDAKCIVDDNALFRHADIAALRDPEEQDPAELQAAANGLSYIRLDGNIGCMVNGAGLAMATMDIIQLAGGRPANFLDVGGGADTRQVCEAFKILLADKNVKAVLVNIFGGIMKCDVIAEGILGALKQVPMQVPLVVRLEGTRVDLGRGILKKSGLPIIEATTMEDAARKAVQASLNPNSAEKQ